MGMARNLASLLNSSGLITSAKIGNGEVSADDLASTLNLTGKTVTLPSGVGGKVLQVVSAYNDTEYTYNLTGATWTDTSISASITPTSSSSKVLVLCSVNFQGNYTSDQNAPVSARINRGGAVLTAKFGFHTVGNNAENQNTNDFITFLDSPNTTSARTYTIQLYATSSKAHYVNRTYGNGGGCSVMTLMEIAS